MPQPEEGATYAPKLSREDGRIDWTDAAAALDRRVRALNPWPGTFSLLGGEVLKVLAARPEAGSGAPGTVLDDALTVACGSGALRLTRVQAPAARRWTQRVPARPPVPPGASWASEAQLAPA